MIFKQLFRRKSKPENNAIKRKHEDRYLPYIWPMDTVLHHSVDATFKDEKEVPKPKYDKFKHPRPVDVKNATSMVVGAWKGNLVLVHYHNENKQGFTCSVAKANEVFNVNGDWQNDEYVRAFGLALMNDKIECLYEIPTE